MKTVTPTTPPEQIVKDVAIAHAVSRCLHVVTDAGVADALGDVPLPAAELARRVSLDADALAAKDRARCGPVAPGDGLYLMRVDY